MFFLVVGILLGLEANFPVLSRPINPEPKPKVAETLLDQYFRVAFNSATGGDFDTSIINYQRAMNIARDKCDRQHALSGVKAAKEGKQILRTRGSTSRPSQHFYYRLRTSTKGLRCITILR